MKNVLFIVYYFPPMGGSGVQRPLKFVKYLKEYGWNPIVLTPEPGMYQIFDDTLLKEVEETEVEVHRVQGNTPFHLMGSSANNTGLVTGKKATILRAISRLMFFPDNKKGWIKTGYKKGLELLKSKEIDLIFSTTPPFSNNILAHKLSEETGIPFVIDYRDLFEENQFENQSSKRLLAKKRKLELSWLKAAKGISVLDEYSAETLQHKVDQELPLKVIPHGYDPADFDKESKGTFEYKDGKLNILYSGLFYSKNQPDTFLKAVKLLFDRSEEARSLIHLHFQGGLDARIKDFIEQLELSDFVSDYGYVNHDVAVSNLKSADLLWMLENFSESLKQVKSGKLFEYIGSQKPILGLVHNGESQKIIEDYKAGFVVSPDNEETIANVIGTILDKWKAGMLKNVDEEIVQKYNRKHITGKLADLFETVVSQDLK